MKIKVIIVEDEPILVLQLEKIIEQLGNGFEVITSCNNGINGFDQILSRKPDIVISDIKMPKMDGLTMLQKLSEKGFVGKFIILSGYDDFEYARKALNLKATQYILKPIDIIFFKELMLKLEDEIKTKNGIKDKPLNSSEAIYGYVLDNYNKNVTANDLSMVFGYNANYISNLFKKNYNITLNKFIINTRIEKAKEIFLKDKNSSIKSVANEVGFNDPLYFSKVFKAEVGVSPKVFIENKDLHN